MFDAEVNDCIQARESISARLDVELPELECERLVAHLRGCAACVVWAEQVEASTLYLRNAVVEVPEAPVVVSLRNSRSRRAGAPLALAAAAAASLVAVLGSHSLSFAPGRTTRTGSTTQQSGAAAQPRIIGVGRLGLDSLPVRVEAHVVQRTSFNAI